jgi:hypothetical protein
MGYDTMRKVAPGHPGVDPCGLACGDRPPAKPRGLASRVSTAHAMELESVSSRQRSSGAPEPAYSSAGNAATSRW